jgi:hypothetical protein
MGINCYKLWNCPLRNFFIHPVSYIFLSCSQASYPHFKTRRRPSPKPRENVNTTRWPKGRPDFLQDGDKTSEEKNTTGSLSRNHPTDHHCLEEPRYRRLGISIALCCFAFWQACLRMRIASKLLHISIGKDTFPYV